MPRVRDTFCFLISDDPSACPFLTAEDTDLLRDLRARLRYKCIVCEYFPADLEQVGRDHGQAATVSLMLLDELRKAVESSDLLSRELDVTMKLADDTIHRGHTLARLSESFDIRDEILDILLYLTDTLGWTMDPRKIIYRGLVALTAGTSFGFNRSVALLAQNGDLLCTFLLGPLDHEDAHRIWRDLNEKGLTALDLLRKEVDEADFERERTKFEAWIDSMRFAINDAPFRQAYDLATVLRVDPGMDIPSRLREFYQQTTFWVLPLFTHLKAPLGAILVDNFLTQQEARPEDLRTMQILAQEISLALERGLAHQQLQEKVERLEEANRLIKDNQAVILKLKEGVTAGEMVLQLTHSVKNPIVAIGGLARQLQRKLGPYAAPAKYTKAIIKEATRLEEMLLDFVRFVDARYAAEKESVDVNQVINVLVQEKGHLWRAVNVTCHLNLAEDPPQLIANRRQLYNCLENLVNNAVEAMPQGGDLFLETSYDDENLMVRVADTGQGMAEEALRNLFKPFFTTKPTGSGLGLYTAKEIIEGLGGSLNILCQPGSGCAVYVKIPPVKEISDGEDSGH